MRTTIKPAGLPAAHGLDRCATTGGQSIDLLMLVIIQEAQRRLSEQMQREPLHATSRLDSAAAVGHNVIASTPLHPLEFN
ncbi:MULTISPECIES: hypothetical protein [Paraburkholderia]|jgi:hypothetical protein|uniref:hypothetical protein n=1 Tax=Paraburkholderia TaxID=1822464 RepID=UPI001B129D98|nr:MULTISPECIES: hypothetical protein [Paraburkholderia]MCX4155310.1 hypothetical protein [Paraburkholderia aspalathi]MDN7164720.1 hypothetical protein [Paraburkholderia sp. SECH2]MDQ6393205.1 hypothetical protein [Paraburkholderia aspalathi]CAE6754534.1 hypothetical protein R75465_02858 [Paraburkholderia aspalathi]